MNSSNLVAVVTAFFILAAGVLVGGCKPGGIAIDEQIGSFEECAAAGYPIMESYPRQCRINDGTTFVEEIDVPDESQGDPDLGAANDEPGEGTETGATGTCKLTQRSRQTAIGC